MGEFVDTNGQHNYIGDASKVKMEDAPYTNVKRFLETHGFRCFETSPMGQTSEESFQSRDDRKVTIGLKDTGIGIPEIDHAHYNDVGTGQNTGSIETLEDLTDFVVYAKYPDSNGAGSPSEGGHEVTQSDKLSNQTAIKDEAGYKSTIAEIIKAQREWISKPMGQYSSWADCKGDGKSDAYCGYLYHNASPEGHGKSLRTAMIVTGRKFLVGPQAAGTSSASGIGTNSQSADGGRVRSEQIQQQGGIPPEGSNPEIGTHSQAGGPGGTVRMDGGEDQFTPGMQNPMTGGQAHQEQPPAPPKPGEAKPGSPTIPDNSKDHANMAYSLGNQPVATAQQHLESQGYQLTGTTAAIGDDLVHTYAHPDGHTVEISSSDGKNISGISYAIPKQPKPEKPTQNVFGQPTQPAAQPKQDMPAYPGGAASISGQGRAEEGGPGSGRYPSGELRGATGHKQTTIPGTNIGVTTVPKFEEVVRSYNKGLILRPGEQMGGNSIFCGICHTATGRIVHYKGLQVCPGCAVRAYGINRRPMRK